MDVVTFVRQALGLETHEEVWPASPLVVEDAEGEVVEYAEAEVDYSPGAERFEGGSGLVREPNSGAILLRFTLDAISRDEPDALDPWGGALGSEAKGLVVIGRRETGEPVKLYLGRMGLRLLEDRRA